ncbi:MAG: DUF1559 domain-containing protein [Pirellulales bacterium]|nr:DUF1559 domain-containing protein [Pirellulales bacterium]
MIHALGSRMRSRRTKLDQRRLRRAFSLVELLVAIAIIGALASLLLPALGSAREAARRAQCMSNLKQIGLAVVNYEQQRRQLPAAGDFEPAASAIAFSSNHFRVNLRSGTNHSWLVRLLPYLEQQPLFDQFDLTMHVSESDSAPQQAQPAVLLCPADESRGRMYDFSPTGAGRRTQFAKSNYAGYTSPFHVDDVIAHGALAHYGQDLRRVTDGASRTILASEVRTREHPLDQRGAWALPWAATSLLAMDVHPLWYSTAMKDKRDAINPFIIDPISFGFTQTPNAKTADVLYECPDLVGEQLDRLPCVPEAMYYISAAPRSNHPGLALFVRLDGGVFALTDGVDESTMAYLIAIDDGAASDGLTAP